MKTFSELYEQHEWYRLNPCDYQGAQALTKTVGKLFIAAHTAVTQGTNGCPCCIGARILFGGLASAAIGYLLAKI